MEEIKEIKKPPKLTRKQKLFIDEYVANWGNWTQAVVKAYNRENDWTARMMASDNLTKPNIQHYLQEYGDVAGSVIKDLMLNGEKDTTRLEAAKYTYDQVHWKATQKIESKWIDINIDIDNASIDDLLKLIKLK